MEGVKAVVGLTGIETEVAGVRMSSDRFVRLQLPSYITAEHVDLMQKDLEVFVSAVRGNPAKVVEMQNAALRNDFGTARRVANEIGLTEERMARAGGGSIGVAAAIVGILVIYALATSGGGEGEPEPVGPGDGNGDAGARSTDGGLPPGGVP